MGVLRNVGLFFDCFTVWIVAFEMLLLAHKEKRKGFVWHLLIFLPILIIPNDAFSAFMPWEGNFFILPVFFLNTFNSWAYPMMFAITLLAVWFCFAIPFRQVLFYGTTAYIMEHLSQHIKWLLLNLTRGEMTHNFDILEYRIFMIASKLIVAVVVYWVFVRSYQKNNEVGVNNIFLGVFAAGSLLIVTVLNSYGFYVGENGTVSSIYAIICCILLLMIQYSVFNEAKSRRAEENMEVLLVKQSQQQKMKKESIEAINRKAHDLKYRINLLKSSQNNITQDETDQLDEAIRSYDGAVETGNAILDIIFTEATALCQREGIRLSILGDASKISFMGNQDIAVLFGNALDNAIEHERSVPQEYRNIDVIFRERGDLLKVSIENYCAQKPRFVDGIPQTTKDNAAGDHGYGVSSIIQTAKNYGGTVSAYQENDRFIISMLFHISQ